MNVRRRLLVLLAVVGFVLASVSFGALTTGASAQPAAGPQPTDVFTGTVTNRTHVSTRHKLPVWAYTVTVKQVFAGGIRSARVQVKTLRSFEPCASTPLRTDGTVYAFSLTQQSETFEAAACGDVAVATGATVVSLTSRYGAPRPPVVTPKPPGQELPAVVVGDVGAGAPASFTRVAAPGLALVIVGLLGLVVVRRVARRR